MQSNILAAFFGFFFWMIAARLYPSDVVGLATALISVALLLTSLSMLGFDIGLIRFLPNEKNKTDMINTCFTIVGIFSMVSALIFIIGLNFWSPVLLFLGEKVNYILLFILFTGIFSIFTLQISVFIAFRTTEFSLIAQAIAGLRLLFLVLLISLGALGIFYSWGMAICAAFIAGILLILKLHSEYRPKPIIRKRIVANMLRFSLGNYVAEIFRQLPGFLLPLLIVNILEPEVGAYFYIAWTIAAILFMIPHAVNFSLLAEGSFQPEKLRSNVIKAMKLIFMLLIPLILLIFFFGDVILSIFGEAYSENALKLLWVLALSAIPLALNNLYITIVRVQQHMKPLMSLYIFTASFTIGIGCILMNAMGLFGIGLAWILSQSIVTLFIIGLFTMKKRARVL